MEQNLENQYLDYASWKKTNEKLIIYTEHLEKPDGWSDDWNKENKEVNWNYQN